MAGGFLIDNLANYLDYGSVVSAATHGTTITANASINTKGSYTQLDGISEACLRERELTIANSP